MKKILFSILFLVPVFFCTAQGMYKPSSHEISTLPAWAQEMYSVHPNVWKTDRLYQDYFREVPFVKSYHTQYYKRWRRSIDEYINPDGFIALPDVTQQKLAEEAYAGRLSRNINTRSGQWSVMGPLQVRNNAGQVKGSQTNVYSIDQCSAFPDILYCGTEPGEVYKSLDHGQTWSSVTMAYDLGGGVSAVEVHPQIPDVVFAGSNNKLVRSVDGGNTWTTLIQQNNLGVNEVLINPDDPLVVLAATNKGLYRSSDGGATFSSLFTQACYDIKTRPGNTNVVYLVKNNPSMIRAEFFLSTDKGATWLIKDQGWYNSTDPNRNDGGARIGVTPADPDRIYVYLIGEAKANDWGFIGLYRSNNGGESWYNPAPPDGGPYSGSHPNLAMGTPTWTYHQGFYNCALMISNDNPDHILVGGLNLWRSNDGGLTFSPQAGYQGNAISMHVDMQDFRAMNGEYWITNDGGIYWSDAFFNVVNQVKMNGIHGSDYWGFGSGWNEDVLVGGLYHNGNLAWYQDYAWGDFLTLGGGEAATGYVHPALNRKTYFSDIGGKVLPTQIGGAVQNFNFGLSPNETYWAAESSEMEFHPHCYNIAYMGKENKLWKTQDAGSSFTLVYAFGTDINAQVKYIEISSSNPAVIYLGQQPSSGNVGKLWKTSDGGLTWNQLTKPAGNSRKMLLAIHPENADVLWLAYPQGGNGQKIYKTADGGLTWSNLTTAMLDGESPHSLVYAGGTNGGVYFCTGRTVYYKNESMPDWVLFNDGLPDYLNTNIARPFYRDGKLRIASYGKGIWESPFYEEQARPVARIMVNQLSGILHCATDTFYFDDYSMLHHLNATWQWTFQGGSPATSTLRNPGVVFTNPGSHLVTLTVTDGNGHSDTDSLLIDLASYVVPFSVNQNFEGPFPPSGWEIYNPDQDVTWSVSSSAGGFGLSARSALFDNFNNDSQGRYDDLTFSVNLTNTSFAKLVFDVAYALYGGQYSDTLQVYASPDCGLTITSLYDKGGSTLATASNTQNFFYPGPAHWRKDTVDLAAFLGVPDLTLAFRNIGRYGNAMYIDNPRVITSATGIAPPLFNPVYASLIPNPVCSGASLTLSSGLQGVFALQFFDLQGKEIKRQSVKAGEQIVLDPEVFKPGVYLYMLNGNTLIVRDKIVVVKNR